MLELGEFGGVRTKTRVNEQSVFICMLLKQSSITSFSSDSSLLSYFIVELRSVQGSVHDGNRACYTLTATAGGPNTSRLVLLRIYM
jgi:hypothetical protein